MSDFNLNKDKTGFWIIAIVFLVLMIYLSQNQTIETPQADIEETHTGPNNYQPPIQENESVINPQEPEVITNACGESNYGYADYTGTNKDGQTCKDALLSERDFECLANPPANYDGIINLEQAISNPSLSCCDTDGTCQW